MCITSRWQSLIQCSWHETRISSTVRSEFSSACRSPGCLDSTSCKCHPSECVTSYDFVFRRNAYLFTFIPAGGSGDFNVDLKDVRVSLAVILRHTEELGLQMEHFRGESNCGWLFFYDPVQLTSAGRQLFSSLTVCGAVWRRLQTRLWISLGWAMCWWPSRSNTSWAKSRHTWEGWLCAWCGRPLKELTSAWETSGLDLAGNGLGFIPHVNRPQDVGKTRNIFQNKSSFQFVHSIVYLMTGGHWKKLLSSNSIYLTWQF